MAGGTDPKLERFVTRLRADARPGGKTERREQAQGAAKVGVPRPDSKGLVIAALRTHLQAHATEAHSAADNERELVEHYVERMTRLV